MIDVGQKQVGCDSSVWKQKSGIASPLRTHCACSTTWQVLVSVRSFHPPGAQALADAVGQWSSFTLTLGVV